MKKLFSFLLVLVLSFSVLFTFGCNKTNKGPKAPGHKVVLFIGDGMGENHIANTELYYDIKLSFTSFETKTMVDTSSRTTMTNSLRATDSAAAATAMATGTRVLNDVVAVDSSGEPIPSITELAKNDGYGTGVVTSDLITGATPAGFSGHARKRTNSAAIMISQIQGTIDLLMGSGSYSAYKDKMGEYGITNVTKYSELSHKTPRIFATFTDVEPVDNNDSTPNLVQLTTFAINYMEKNFPDGYFLMIEGAKIDKKSHNNDILAMMENMVDFSNAIETAKTLVTGDYTFIVTADHETGELDLATSAQEIDESITINSENEMVSSLYHSTNHSTANVPLYYYSTKGDVHPMLENDVILNTNIFDLCCYLLEIEVA